LGGDGADRAAVEVKGHMGESFCKSDVKGFSRRSLQRIRSSEGGQLTAAVIEFGPDPDLVCVQVLHGASLL